MLGDHHPSGVLRAIYSLMGFVTYKTSQGLPTSRKGSPSSSILEASPFLEVWLNIALWFFFMGRFGGTPFFPTEISVILFEYHCPLPIQFPSAFKANGYASSTMLTLSRASSSFHLLINQCYYVTSNILRYRMVWITPFVLDFETPLKVFAVNFRA